MPCGSERGLRAVRERLRVRNRNDSVAPLRLGALRVPRERSGSAERFRSESGKVHPTPRKAQIRAWRRRNALATTVSELRLIAAPANIGLSSHPVNGYNNPAASGIPAAL